MSPYIVVGLVAAVIALGLLSRVSSLAMGAAYFTAYLGSYVVIVGGSAAFVVTRIAVLGTLTVFNHAWVASLYGLAWAVVPLVCRPLLKEGLTHFNVAYNIMILRLEQSFRIGFAIDKPCRTIQRLWFNRPAKPHVYYVK